MLKRMQCNAIEQDGVREKREEELQGEETEGERELERVSE
jgi:hypothetical protein